jgi:hypothetical protein
MREYEKQTAMRDRYEDPTSITMGFPQTTLHDQCPMPLAGIKSLHQLWPQECSVLVVERATDWIAVAKFFFPGKRTIFVTA